MLLGDMPFFLKKYLSMNKVYLSNFFINVQLNDILGFASFPLTKRVYVVYSSHLVTALSLKVMLIVDILTFLLV